MINLTIDDRTVSVEKNATILQAAEKLNIKIPTLCYNEEMAPIGSCRICVVEAIKGGESLIVSACNTGVEEGMKVYTKSEKAIEARKFAVKILYSENPSVKLIRDLAEEYGVVEDINVRKSECIHCERCVHACRDVVGQNAIVLTTCGLSYGNDAPSLKWDFDKCIACGTCAFVCPTGAVKMHDHDGVRTLLTPESKQDFTLKKCVSCGSYFMPEVQAQYLMKKTDLPADKFDQCMNCR